MADREQQAGRESAERGEDWTANPHQRGSREWFAFEDGRREGGAHDTGSTPGSPAKKCLAVGERYSLAGGGWPPATIVRDLDGRYHVERFSTCLRQVLKKEISAEDAENWIDDECDRRERGE